jgi:predicted aldo/keto reductase-like oxidoreductase
MSDTSVSRRVFVQAGTATVAGLAMARVAMASSKTPVPAEVTATRSYNPNMEYRRLGKTGLWVSAVCLGGHWKRVDKIIKAQAAVDPYCGPKDQGDMHHFLKNREEVVNHCLDVGINSIDFAGDAEPETYCKVLGSRRDKVYLNYSHPASELRNPAMRTAAKLVERFEAGLKRCKLEYADSWRLMALEHGSSHAQADVDAMIEALAIAKKKGLCRFTGFSTHDRPWAKMLIEKYPDQIQILCTPYTAHSKMLPKDSLFEAITKHDVGVFAIKPFASNSLFKGDSSPGNPHSEEDDKMARLAIRYILSNPAITAPIPGMVSVHHVDNVVKAIQERRELDESEHAQLDEAGRGMWARLPAHYQWLKDWEYV